MADLQFFERMVPDLEARGVTPEQLTRLRREWLGAPGNERLPCPLCALKGVHGKLKSMPNAYGVERMSCDTCKEPIELA